MPWLLGVMSLSSSGRLQTGRLARKIGRLSGDYLLLGLFSVASQIVYLCILPTTFEGDAIGYYLDALYLVGDPRGAFTYYRPPGYPLFMVLTGLTWLHDLDLAIFVQAAMGAAVPLLVFAALRRVNRTAAFVAAALLAWSGISYVYAKLFITDQVYLFCVTTTLFATARFIIGKPRKFAYAILAISGGVAALMMHGEGVYLAIFSFLMLLIATWPMRRLALKVALAGGAALALVMAWSVERAAILGDPTVIGSLSNISGKQLFGRIYVDSAYEIHRWRCVVAQSCASQAMSPISSENGPATRRLFEIVRDWAIRSGYEPGALLADFVVNPTEGDQGRRPYNRLDIAWNESLRLYGYSKYDKFLMRVAIEAIVAHPEIIYGMIANASDWFGISFEALVQDLRSPRDFVFPFFANGGVDTYEVSGMNIKSFAPENTNPYISQRIARYEPIARANALLAQKYMPRELLQAYQKANEKPMRVLDWQLLDVGREAHNLVRNGAGFVLFLTWPFLIFARPRLLALYLVGCLALFVAAYTLAFGYNMRYEHVVMTIMVMVAAMSAYTLVRIVARILHARASR